MTGTKHQITSIGESSEVNKERLALFSWEDWRALKLYQDFDQLLVIEAANGALQERSMRLTVADLLEGTPKILFELTSADLIVGLVDRGYFSDRDGEVGLSDDFMRQLSRYISGDLNPFEEETTSTDRVIELNQNPSGQVTSGASTLEESSDLKRGGSTLDYIDPFTVISRTDEQLFTTHRLDITLSNLDGLQILQKHLQGLLKLESADDFNRLMKAMERFELVRLESQFVKLNLHGNKVVRLPRSERLKVLGRIASRMRQEDGAS